MKKRIWLVILICFVSISLVAGGFFLSYGYKQRQENEQILLKQKEIEEKINAIDKKYSAFLIGNKTSLNDDLGNYFDSLVDTHTLISVLNEDELTLKDLKNIKNLQESLKIKKDDVEKLKFDENINKYIENYTKEEQDEILKIYNESVITKNIKSDELIKQSILDKIAKKEKVVNYLSKQKNYYVDDNNIYFEDEESLSTFNKFNTGIKALKKIQYTVRKLPILMYHAVDDKAWGDTTLFVKINEFERQMKYLKDEGYTTLFLSEINQAFNYEKPIIITFDDGYKNVYDYAFPILKKYNLKSDFYIITRWMDGETFVTPEMVKEMDESKIMEIGSHTLTHMKLGYNSYEEQEQELKNSKKDLEELLKKEITTVAYPYGCYNSDTVNISKKYYKYGVTVNKDFNYEGKLSNYTLNRIKISRSTTFNQFKSLIGEN